MSTRTFTVMASDYCMSIFMPRVVAQIASAAPGIRLVLRSLNAPIEKMLSGEVDLCITTDDRSLLCREARRDDLQSEHLFSDEFVGVVAGDHPLSEAPSLGEYLSFPHVGVQMPGVLSTIEAASIRQCAPHYAPAYIVADFSLVVCMVAQTTLVGVVQKRLATTAKRTLPIRTFALPFAIPAINETMLWHPRQLEDASHVWLRNVMLQVAEAWLGDSGIEQFERYSSDLPGYARSTRLLRAVP